MFHHVNAILLSAAGVAITLAYLARRIVWLRANRPADTAIRWLSPAEFVQNTRDATLAVFTPTGVPWITIHREVIVDDDTGEITISGPTEYEHEGTTEHLTPGAELARVPEVKEVLTSRERAEQERHAERARVREISDMFERFDRMTTRGMAHVDTICAATIQRWIDEADAECELAKLHEYFTAEQPLIERAYAEALLVS